MGVEMDALLKGFGYHNATNDSGDRNQESNEKHVLDPFQMPTLLMPPPRATKAMCEGHGSASTLSGGDSDAFSSGNKPMSSITFNLGGSERGVRPKNVCGTGPRFLPRRMALPVPQNNLGSVFKSS